MSNFLKLNFLLAIICLIIGAIGTYHSFQIGAYSKIYAISIFAFIFIISILMLINYFKEKQTKINEVKEVLKPLAVILIYGLWGVLINSGFSYLITSFVFTFIVLLLLQSKNYFKKLIISFLISSASYTLFIFVFDVKF